MKQSQKNRTGQLTGVDVCRMRERKKRWNVRHEAQTVLRIETKHRDFEFLAVFLMEIANDPKSHTDTCSVEKRKN